MAFELIAIRAGNQDFCVDVQMVREIRGWTMETGMPHAPGYVRGMINLRGVVLPIIDLGQRLGFAATEPSQRHAILVVETGRQTLGLLVEAVSDIFAAPDEQMQPVPEAAAGVTRQFLKGVFAVENRLVSFIDVANILPPIEEAA